MISIEDFEFVAETAEGERRAVVSKAALRNLAGRSGVSPSEVAKIYRAELDAIVERKIAMGHGDDDPIRINGTDL